MFKYGLIIAGGSGSRMKPLTDYIPKPLIKYKGQKLISYGLEFFKKNGINEIIVTYGYKSEQLVLFLEKNVSSLINTIDKDNSYFMFNTIIKYIGDPILLLPCDIIIDIDVKQLEEEYDILGQPACMIVPIKAQKNIAADFIHSDEYNNIMSINRTLESPINASGVQIINPQKINEIIDSSDSFYEVWMKLIEKKEIKMSNITPIKWEAIDSIEQIV